jgi:hypothetical protein
MSGRRPLIKRYFAALRLIVGAVMLSSDLPAKDFQDAMLGNTPSR